MNRTTQKFFRHDLRRWHTDPPTSGAVEVTIDWDYIVQHYGPRAAFSKGKKTQAMNGAIVVKFKGAA